VREKRYGHGSAASIAAQEQAEQAAAGEAPEATEDAPTATEAADLPGEDAADEPQPSGSGEPVEDEAPAEPVPARE